MPAAPRRRCSVTPAPGWDDAGASVPAPFAERDLEDTLRTRARRRMERKRWVVTSSRSPAHRQPRRVTGQATKAPTDGRLRSARPSAEASPGDAAHGRPEQRPSERRPEQSGGHPPQQSRPGSAPTIRVPLGHLTTATDTKLPTAPRANPFSTGGGLARGKVISVTVPSQSASARQPGDHRRLRPAGDHRRLRPAGSVADSRLQPRPSALMTTATLSAGSAGSTSPPNLRNTP